MARPLNHAQAQENAAFLAALARTGNIRLAAREVGLSPATLHGRRATHPAFAEAWETAIIVAHARLDQDGGRKGPEAKAATKAQSLRTRGGEPVVVRRRDGKLQLRAAQPGKLTRQCEQTFLAALSATANVRLSAAAAGAAVAAFYRRRRNNAAFAREMRLALEMGYERLEMALLASADPASHVDDAWRHNDPPPIPPMTANQALQLMYLHQKEARLGGTPEPLRRRKGESSEVQSMRLALLYEARSQRLRDDFIIAETARRARGEPVLFGPAILPDLSQVTGWSKADKTKAPHDADTALFGGWRLADLKRRGK